MVAKLMNLTHSLRRKYDRVKLKSNLIVITAVNMVHLGEGDKHCVGGDVRECFYETEQFK